MTTAFNQICFVLMRFQVFAVKTMKLTVFLDVAPCSLVHVNQRFRGNYSLRHNGPEATGMKLL
jgi:hypothetical protein